MNDDDYAYVSNKTQIKLSNPNDKVKKYGRPTIWPLVQTSVRKGMAHKPIQRVLLPMCLCDRFTDAAVSPTSSSTNGQLINSLGNLELVVLK